MKRLLLALSVCAGLAACATNTVPPPPPPPEEAPPGPAAAFRAHDFAWSTERGTASVHGQVAFAQGSARYTCAGQAVILTPDAPFSRARMISLYGSADRAALPVPVVRSRQAGRPSDDYSAFVRRATCDAAQMFTFQGLPAGSWFVIVVAQPAAAGAEPMALMRRVITRAGVARSVVLD